MAIFEAKVKNAGIVVKFMQKMSVRMRARAFTATAEQIQVLFKHCQQMLSEDDHTLAMLRAMGHPYGFTHPAQIHEPDEIIHRQNGELLAGLRVQPPSGNAGGIIRGRVYNDSITDKWIQQGTTLMRARPYMKYIEETYGPEVVKTIAEAILSEMGRG